MEVPQFSPRLPNPSDPPRGFEETPTVGVLATASLLRTFQPQPGDTVFAVIVAAFGRFVRRSRTSSKHFRRHMYSRCMARSCVAVARAQTLGVHYKNPKRNFHLSQSGNRHFALCLQEHDRFHARRIGEPPKGARPQKSKPMERPFASARRVLILGIPPGTLRASFSSACPGSIDIDAMLS